MIKRQAVAKSLATTRPRSRFGKQTYGNEISFTFDGQETFRQMYEKIHQAKTSYISPTMTLTQR